MVGKGKLDGCAVIDVPKIWSCAMGDLFASKATVRQVSRNPVRQAYQKLNDFEVSVASRV